VGMTSGMGDGVVVVSVGGNMWTGGRRGGPSDGLSNVAVPVVI
jgi:hypothetical protein